MGIRSTIRQPSPFGKNDHSSSDYPASNSRMVGAGIQQKKNFRLLTVQKNQCPWKLTVFFQGRYWKSHINPHALPGNG